MNQSISNQRKSAQSGFTLVELIVVIVLLGILGVTALGKFQNLSGEAEVAALEGIASQITGASSINYSKSLISTTYDVGIGDGATGGTDNMNTVATATACTEAGLAFFLTGVTTLPDVGTATAVTATAFVTGTTTAIADAALCSAAGDSFSCQLTGGTSATALTTIFCTE